MSGPEPALLRAIRRAFRADVERLVNEPACPTCRGSGRLRAFGESVTCVWCRGTGRIPVARA